MVALQKTREALSHEEEPQLEVLHIPDDPPLSYCVRIDRQITGWASLPELRGPFLNHPVLGPLIRKAEEMNIPLHTMGSTVMTALSPNGLPVTAVRLTEEQTDRVRYDEENRCFWFGQYIVVYRDNVPIVEVARFGDDSDFDGLLITDVKQVAAFREEVEQLELPEGWSVARHEVGPGAQANIANNITVYHEGHPTVTLFPAEPDHSKDGPVSELSALLGRLHNFPFKQSVATLRLGTTEIKLQDPWKVYDGIRPAQQVTEMTANPLFARKAVRVLLDYIKKRDSTKKQKERGRNPGYWITDEGGEARYILGTLLTMVKNLSYASLPAKSWKGEEGEVDPSYYKIKRGPFGLMEAFVQTLHTKGVPVPRDTPPEKAQKYVDKFYGGLHTASCRTIASLAFLPLADQFRLEGSIAWSHPLAMLITGAVPSLVASIPRISDMYPGVHMLYSTLAGEYSPNPDADGYFPDGIDPYKYLSIKEFKHVPFLVKVASLNALMWMGHMASALPEGRRIDGRLELPTRVPDFNSFIALTICAKLMADVFTFAKNSGSDQSSVFSINKVSHSSIGGSHYFDEEVEGLFNIVAAETSEKRRELITQFVTGLFQESRIVVPDSTTISAKPRMVENRELIVTSHIDGTVDPKRVAAIVTKYVECLKKVDPMTGRNLYDAIIRAIIPGPQDTFDNNLYPHQFLTTDEDAREQLEELSVWGVIGLNKKVRQLLWPVLQETFPLSWQEVSKTTLVEQIPPDKPKFRQRVAQGAQALWSRIRR